MSGCRKLSNDIQFLQNNIERDTLLALYDGSLRKKIETDKLDLASKKKAYADLKCELVLAEEKANAVVKIADEYSEIDRQRIEAESKKERNKKILLSTIVLVGAMFLILKFSKK